MKSGTNCKRCGAPIRFIRSGKTEKYYICENKRLTIITDDGFVVSGYESHFAHCPYSKEFRRTKGVL